ncbi:MAG: protein BatD [Candidatus Omnitrophica bacterium]|nr:protein BatD [Candidatus Omnitrophota bacterium]
MLLLGFLILIASHGFAQDISVEVEISSRKILLGSTAQLIITVNGSQAIEPIQLPKVEGFNVNYLGPSTRVSIINGQHSSSKAFAYSLFPLKVGQFQIPVFDVIASGKTYRVDPILIEVVSTGDQSVPGPGSQVKIEDKIFVTLELPKDEVYLSERLTIKVFLFISGLSVNEVQYPQFDNVGFSIGKFEKPKQYQQVISGVRYGVVEFSTEIYPTRIGELRLGPAKIECNILVKSSARQGRPRGRNRIFNDDFFNSFFDRHEKQPIALESKESIINVLPLPEESRPQDFSGGVGQFDFNVSVSPAEVKEGDPVTMRLTVIGEGNLAAIQMPSLPSTTDFKLYDPQVFEKDNIKKTEQVIIPRLEEITEIPQIQFTYFDPKLKKYQTIKKGPFPITVRKLEKGEEFKVVGLEGEIRVVEPETLGQDIVFIKTKPGRLRLIGGAIYKNGLFYICIFVLTLFWSGGLIYYKRSDRIKTDSVYARRLQAPRQAKKGLAQAKKLIAAHNGGEFYDTVFKTIQQYLGNKLHLSSGAVAFETVQSYLSANNIEQKVIDNIKVTYDECDMIRYASADVSRENMDASYQRLAQIIDHLERFLK